VSHQPERKEKDCLNCGTIVHGRFCHVCGQENIVTKEKFWSLLKHFVYDILHFDGKFFHTIRDIFVKPGHVPKKYVQGRRAYYLHPIRMYLFTSAIFFILFFALSTKGVTINETPLTKKQRLQTTADVEKELKQRPADTSLIRQLALLKDTTKPVWNSDLGKAEGFVFYTDDGKKYNSVEQYDSLQKGLPPDKKDNWFEKMFSRKGIEINQKYKGNMKEGANILWNVFLHKLPYMLFISLPFFALILKLLYVRRKNFYYSDHVIFTLFHYIFSFIVLLFIICVNALQNWTGVGDLEFIIAMLFLAWMIYLLVEMKNFYGQRWFKTVMKFLLLNLLGLICMLILFVFFLFFSIFQM